MDEDPPPQEAINTKARTAAIFLMASPEKEIVLKHAYIKYRLLKQRLVKKSATLPLSVQTGLSNSVADTDNHIHADSL